MTVSYPFDPTGLSDANKVTNEVHVITPANYRDYHFIVPTHAPFFRPNLVVVRHPSGEALIEGQDYFLGHLWIEATLKLGKPVFGSIQFYNLKDSDGNSTRPTMVQLLQYQTLGGEWTLDQAEILEILANTLYNPRTAKWEDVTDVPDTFPVISHAHDVASDSMGYDDLIAVMEDILETMQNGPGDITKETIGLGNVQNYPMATNQQALEGTNAFTYMSAFLVKLVVDQAVIESGGLVLGPGEDQAYQGSAGLELEQLVDTLDQSVTLLNASNQQLQAALNSAPGQLSYRGSSNTESGLPDTDVTVTSDAVADSLALRGATGTLKAIAAATADELTTLQQVNDLIGTATQELATNEDIDTINETLDTLTESDQNINQSIQTLTQEVQTVSDSLAEKVDKELGKGLSTNDFTTGYKDQLDGLDEVIDAIATDITAIADQNDTNTQAIGTLQNTDVDHNTRLNRLENSPVATNQSLGNVSGNVEIDIANGTVIYFRMEGNVILDLILPPNHTANTTTIITMLVVRAGSYTLTPPADTRHPGGTMPPLTLNAIDVLVGMKFGNEDWIIGRSWENVPL